jgi:uncharacterized membrane protein YjgN (DUF898 family)
MDDTIPMPLDPRARSAPASRPFSAVEPARHTLPIAFTGSGSEYFRIWIVNLLLTVVTLGLYFPWAKVRRLRYFYGNTRVGDDTLDFHGSPSRMLRGFLLVAALLGLYSLAGRFSPTAGLVAFLIIAAIWPALFRAGQRFRLANTSWRGLRFRFNGTLGGAYRAMLPLFVPSAVGVALAALLGGAGGRPRPGADVLLALVPVALVLLLPLFWWLLKKYQHDHCALGDNQTRLHTGAGSFYLVFLKALGVSLAVGLGGGLAVALVGGAGAFALFGGRPRDAASAGAAVFAIFLTIALVYLAVIVVVRPYATARLQNLVWNATCSADIRFVSALRFRPLLWLTLKNWLLIVVTLGLYLPFAAIAMARLRLQAVTVQLRVDADALESRVRERAADDAAGDAAGDLFGIDIGL